MKEDESHRHLHNYGVKSLYTRSKLKFSSGRQRNQKAASVADTLKFHEVAINKLGARQKEEIQGMAKQHELDMD